MSIDYYKDEIYVNAISGRDGAGGVSQHIPGDISGSAGEIIQSSAVVLSINGEMFAVHTGNLLMNTYGYGWMESRLMGVWATWSGEDVKGAIDRHVDLTDVGDEEEGGNPGVFLGEVPVFILWPLSQPWIDPEVYRKPLAEGIYGPCLWILSRVDPL